MRGRRAMKQADFHLVDDVTRLNTGLLCTLMLHPKHKARCFFQWGCVSRDQRLRGTHHI